MNSNNYVDRHKGDVAIIVASGPSISNGLIHKFRKTITRSVVVCVNMGVLAVENADYFYFTDGAPFSSTYFSEAVEQSGRTICGCSFNHADAMHLRISKFSNKIAFVGRRDSDTCDFSSSDGLLIRGSDAVHSAAHLAHLMGCTRIVLFGVDLCSKVGGEAHFVDESRYYPEIYNPWANGKDPFNLLPGKKVIKIIELDGERFEIQRDWFTSFLVWKEIKRINPEVQLYSESSRSLLRFLFPKFSI